MEAERESWLWDTSVFFSLFPTLPLSHLYHDVFAFPLIRTQLFALFSHHVHDYAHAAFPVLSWILSYREDGHSTRVLLSSFALVILISKKQWKCNWHMCVHAHMLHLYIYKFLYFNFSLKIHSKSGCQMNQLIGWFGVFLFWIYKVDCFSWIYIRG